MTTIITDMWPPSPPLSTLGIAHIWANLGWACQCLWPLHHCPSIAMSLLTTPTANHHVTIDNAYCKPPCHHQWCPLQTATSLTSTVPTVVHTPPHHQHWHCLSPVTAFLTSTLPSTHHHVTAPTRGWQATSQQTKERENKRIKGGGIGIG